MEKMKWSSLKGEGEGGGGSGSQSLTSIGY